MSNVQSSALGGDLVVGEFVEYEQRAWRVGLVNFTRARLDPVNRPAGAKDGDFAGSVNVGPASTLRRLSPEAAASYSKPSKPTSNQESDTMAPAAEEASTGEVSGMPVPAKKDRVRVARTRKATGSKATATKPRKAAAKKEAAVADKPCKCGCGGKTASHFIAGHDARFKGWLLKVERGHMKVEELPKVVQKAYEWKKRGSGFIPTLNYKGEKHTGYESRSEA